MRKKSGTVVSLMLTAVMGASFLAGCKGSESSSSAGGTGSKTDSVSSGAVSAGSSAGETSASGKKSYKIGVTYADLSNSVWAEEADAIEAMATELGHEVTVLDCGNDASTQITQIENFVANGCDAIIIGATDIGSINSAAQEAIDKGVIVEAFGTEMMTYTTTLLADNSAAGELLAEEAAKWVEEHYNGAAKIGLVNYYESPDCVARAEAFTAKIGELSPDSEIVAEGSAGTAVVGMELAENFMQANPDMGVIFCIGDGAASGVLQAVISSGRADQIGVFSCDGTVECLSQMAQGAPLIADCSFGAGWELGEAQLQLVLNILEGREYEKITRLPNTIVTYDNLQEKVSYWGYEDQIDTSMMK